MHQRQVKNSRSPQVFIVTERLPPLVYYSCIVISAKILQAFLVPDLAAIPFRLRCILVTLNIMLK